MLWAALALVGLATIHDLRSREIPDWISLALVFVAVVAAASGAHFSGWLGLLLGGALAFALSLPLFALGGLGGGDVKLLTGLGVLLGPAAFASTLFWIAVAGGILALVVALCKKRDLPYVPAIALGFLMYVVWPDGVAYLLGI